MAERVGAVVFGAGQAGLAASHHLTRLGRDHVVTTQPGLALLRLAFLYQLESPLLSGVGDDVQHAVETSASEPLGAR